MSSCAAGSTDGAGALQRVASTTVLHDVNRLARALRASSDQHAQSAQEKLAQLVDEPGGERRDHLGNGGELPKDP
ncbi:hypothetical protein [Amycolatopsis pithecellobii]|uniref:Uncharacterized protein n=1 Tax=Amycolatopsis pithecellobii TaxID=664692 RepID=A0A6N7ZC86_9PSEU|nr:hypothetical protein [Amycolatopsis pithecellobii]MTD59373.1 hypothetical protein [Amycolatopsis pithecellobii]